MEALRDVIAALRLRPGFNVCTNAGFEHDRFLRWYMLRPCTPKSLYPSLMHVTHYHPHVEIRLNEPGFYDFLAVTTATASRLLIGSYTC